MKQHPTGPKGRAVCRLWSLQLFQTYTSTGGGTGHSRAHLHHVTVNKLGRHGSSYPLTPSSAPSTTSLCPQGHPTHLSGLPRPHAGASPSLSLRHSPSTPATPGRCTPSLSRTLFPGPLLQLTSLGWLLRPWHSSSVLLEPFSDSLLTPRLGEHSCCEHPTPCCACLMHWTVSAQGSAQQGKA